MSVKISDMTSASTPLGGTEQIEVVQSGNTRRTTVQAVANLASTISGLTPGTLPKAATSSTLNDSVVIQSSTSIGIGTSAPDRKFHVEQDSAATNTVTQIARLTSTSSGTPAAGIGTGLEFETETAAGNNEIGLSLESVASSVSAGAEYFDAVFRQMRNGSQSEVMRVKPGGSDVTLQMGSTSGTATPVSQIQAVSSGASASMSVLCSGSNGVVGMYSASQTSSFTANDVTGNIALSDVANNLIKDGSATNTVGNALKLTHSTSGTPATGIGTGLQFETETAAPTTNRIGSTIESVSTDVTGGSEDFDLVFKTMGGGAAAAEAVRIKSDKSTTFSGPVVFPSYTVAGVPAASSYTGGMIYVSNETGGAVPAFSDGTNWRRVTDRAIIS